jgi:hypothetical protein
LDETDEIKIKGDVEEYRVTIWEGKYQI